MAGVVNTCPQCGRNVYDMEGCPCPAKITVGGVHLTSVLDEPVVFNRPPPKLTLALPLTEAEYNAILEYLLDNRDTLIKE